MTSTRSSSSSSSSSAPLPPLPPPPPPSSSGSLALAVLTDSALLRGITASITGWPFKLYAFRRERVPRHKLYDAVYWIATFPRRRGAVLHVVLAEDNLPMLRLGYEVLKSLPPDDPSLPLLDTSTVMGCATHFGRFEALQWMVETAALEPQWWSRELDLMLAPLGRGDLVMLELLFTHCSPESTRIDYNNLKRVVCRDDTAAIKWAYDRGYDFTGQGSFRTKFVMDHAASLEMLEVMHSGPRDVGCSSRAMDKAARLGDLRMVQFLHEHHTEGCTDAAMNSAAACGSLDVVRYLHEHQLVPWCSPHAMDMAAKNGHLEIVKYLHENRTEGCSSAAMDAAARHGDMEIVRFLHENRSEGCTKNAMDGAAANGHLEVVRFLHEHRREGCTKNAMDTAAANGHLEVVEFLHTHRNEGCTLQALHRAVLNEHVDVCRFLCENRSEGATPSAIDFAAARGSLEVVQLLVANLRRRRRNVHSKAAMDAAAGGGHLEIVRFLHTVDSEDAGGVRVGCSTKALDAAAANGHVDVVRFLHENRREGGSFRALRDAAAGGHVPVLAFLLEQQLDGVVWEGSVDEALDEARDHGHAAAAALLQQRLDEWRAGAGGDRATEW